MTAEERMAYFQGEKRRPSAPYYGQKKEKNSDKVLFKLKFMIALLLLIAFLSMDYMEYEMYGLSSERIIQEVITDFDFAKIGDFAL